MTSLTFLLLLVLGNDGGTALLKSSLRDVMKAHRAQWHRCYEPATPLTRHPGVTIIEFVIAADGQVSSAKVSSTDDDQPDLAECLRQVVLQLRFAATGAAVVVRYPFEVRMSLP